MNNATSLRIPPVMPVTYAVFEVIVAVVAIVGNILVIIAFCVEKKLRRLTNYYIFSLSVADLLVGLVGVPSALLTKVGLPENAFYPCLAMLSVLIVLCTVSILNLLAVSIDRYWAIIHPFQYHTNMNVRAVTCIIVTCWFLGCVLGFLPLFGWNSGPEESGRCLFIPIIKYEFLVVIHFGTIVAPGILMAVAYLRIYRVVVKQLRKETDTSAPCSHYRISASKSGSSTKRSNNRSKESNMSKRSLLRNQWKELAKAKDLGIIIFVFLVCWIPLYTCNTIIAFCNCKLFVPMVEFFIVLSHANSAVNPFLYACRMRDFRGAIKRLLMFKLVAKPNTSDNWSHNQTTQITDMS